MRSSFIRAARWGGLWGLAAVMFLAGQGRAYAVTTPQKYCESLAAVSCEILNVEIGGAATTEAGSHPVAFGAVKYCRNKSFYIVPLAGESSTDAWGRYVWLYLGRSHGVMNRFSCGSSGCSGGDLSAWSNAEMCSFLP